MRNHHEKLGREGIPKLIFTQSYPAILGLLFMSLYNLIDTIFVGQAVGALGIAALTVASPIQLLVLGFGKTLGIGGASIISRALGAGNMKTAEETLGTFFSLVLIVGLAVMIAGLILTKPLSILFGATATILPFATEYLTIVLSGGLFLCFIAAANDVIRAEGDARFAMNVMIVAVVSNLILDPILIFGFDMGIRGAAYATVLSQLLAAIFSLKYFMSRKNSIHIGWQQFKPDLKIGREILAIGSSSLGRQGAGSATQAVLNHSLAFFAGDLGIAAIGIIVRILMLILMPLYGLNQGMQPVLGYNFGKQQFERAKSVILLAMKYATMACALAFVVLISFAKPAVSIFTGDRELIEFTAFALRIIVFSLPFIGFQVIASGVYQALGHALKAFILSLLRQLILLIPLIFLLPLLLDLTGVFLAFPLADFIAGIITAFMIYGTLKHLNKPEFKMIHK
jgi:putative MATE family efflux protein